MNTSEIPKEIMDVVNQLNGAGHEAYIVGGCVRDILRGKKPKDWDVTTNAKPEEIMALFPNSFYENKFLTVTVPTDSEDPTLKEVEITTYRAEGKYTDKRHPDDVRYAQTLEEDLSRRDFTMNAIALDPYNLQPTTYNLIDPFKGQEDIKHNVIRAVGNPEKRFEEDALRMIRAVRFAVQLDFEIEEKTEEAIRKLADSVMFVSFERIRDEFIKMMNTPRAREAIEMMHELGLLKHVIPELEEGIGMQNRPKIFTVWEHNLKALEWGAKAKYPVDVRIAALLHDAGKARTRGPMKNNEWTFYGHDVVGGKMAAQILTRLHFPRHAIEKIATLIRWHLFKYDPDEGITDSAVRRLICHVGAENMSDLVKLRICDRMGMDVPKAVPYRLRHFQFRVEKILREEEMPTPKMLKVNGEDIMQILKIIPCKKIGQILEVLLQEVIDEPSLNTREHLEKRVTELGVLPEAELIKIADKAESQVELAETEREAEMKARYWVK